MSSIEGIRLSGPPSHPQVRLKKPAPYSRPSIDLGGAPEQKRDWRSVLACDLAVGDTVPGVGQLYSVTDHVSSGEPGQRPQWTVTVHGGDGNTRLFAGTDSVLAFVSPAPSRDEHELYVAAGYCPSIYSTKTWCNGPVGHNGRHWAKRIPHPDIPVGPHNPERISWR